MPLVLCSNTGHSNPVTRVFGPYANFSFGEVRPCSLVLTGANRHELHATPRTHVHHEHHLHPKFVSAIIPTDTHTCNNTPARSHTRTQMNIPLLDMLPNTLAPSGTHEGCMSLFGTFDQAGNLVRVPHVTARAFEGLHIPELLKFIPAGLIVLCTCISLSASPRTSGSTISIPPALARSRVVTSSTTSSTAMDACTKRWHTARDTMTTAWDFGAVVTR